MIATSFKMKNQNLFIVFSAFFSIFLVIPASSQLTDLFYPGFTDVGSNLTLSGAAEIQKNGILKLTNDSRRLIGHAISSSQIRLKNSTEGKAFSFSTSFAFTIIPEYPKLGGHGMAFTISPSKALKGLPSQYLGLLNASDSSGNFSNHLFAVEFDTVQDFEFGDINDNHVGIDINSLNSTEAAAAAYFNDDNSSKSTNFSLNEKPILAWIDYDSTQNLLNVTVAPFSKKPRIPILSVPIDLSLIFDEFMYVGFSASTGLFASAHYVLGWSFKINGEAQVLDLSQLPKLVGPKTKYSKLILTIGLPLVSVCLITVATLVIVYVIRRNRGFVELIEDWEVEFQPQNYKYRDLYIATKGFSDNELLGSGGFGNVYKGVLPTTKAEIAVKKVSHKSKQGMKEFVAEIASMSRLRHRNLVPLLGYCRRKGKLLLVYDYMPNGSLDKYLFDQPETTLTWSQRFRVIKGVASGMLYLHEEWEQVVVHRDVKASNILLDNEFNARLGDFGLARFYDHGTDHQTTHVAGTLGYLAPELTRMGKATTSTDIYAFGAFLLEVACGRRPINRRGPPEDAILVDRVFSCWNRGHILEAMDQKLGSEFVAEEVELVLKLGLLCSHSEPSARPSMRRVVDYLEKLVQLQSHLSQLRLSANGLTFVQCNGLDEFVPNICTYQSSVEDSILSCGR